METKLDEGSGEKQTTLWQMIDISSEEEDAIWKGYAGKVARLSK